MGESCTVSLAGNDNSIPLEPEIRSEYTILASSKHIVLNIDSLGYEIHGMENLPTKGGGLVVYHHALIPLDMVFLACEYYVEYGRTLGGIVHYNFPILSFGASRVRFADFIRIWGDTLRRPEIACFLDHSCLIISQHESSYSICTLNASVSSRI